MDISIHGIDLNANCRICFQSYPEMCDLFNENNQYQRMLSESGKVDVQLNDGLPTVICENCLKEMIQAFHFMTKCQEADRKLRKLNAIKLETKEIEYADGSKKIMSGITVKVDPDQQNDLRNDELVDCGSLGPKIEGEQTRAVRRKNYFRKTSKDFPKKCPECQLIIKCESIMILHMRTHTNERPYQCAQCGECFKTKGVLKGHLFSHANKNTLHPKLKLECEYCKKMFLRNTDLIIHRRVHTKETPYSCELCKCAFTQLSSLNRHIKRHSGLKSHTCKICNKAFTTSYEVRKHYVVHSNMKSFNCNICGSLFKTKTSLTNHIAIIHENSRSVICELCGKSFKTRLQLGKHITRAHSESSGHCGICNMDFRDIKEHNTQHTGETPYQCDYCEKKFINKYRLVQHLRFHADIKFQCSVKDCKKVFPMLHMLSLHSLKYHKKQTPFACEHCNKGFYKDSNLTRHVQKKHPKNVNIAQEVSNVN